MCEGTYNQAWGLKNSIQEPKVEAETDFLKLSSDLHMYAMAHVCPHSCTQATTYVHTYKYISGKKFKIKTKARKVLLYKSAGHLIDDIEAGHLIGNVETDRGITGKPLGLATF